MGRLMLFDCGRSRFPQLGALDVENYTGEYMIDEETGYFRFLTSGLLNLKNDVKVDIFLVGGGASGSPVIPFNSMGGLGGGGGYTATRRSVTLFAGYPYSVMIGKGGINSDGEESKAFGLHAAGGKRYTNIDSDIILPDGGSGGGGLNNSSAGGTGGSDGEAGTGTNAGNGQGATTRAFGEEDGELFSDGGAGGTSGGLSMTFASGGIAGGGSANPVENPNGRDNTGSGGAGGSCYAQDEGDGLIGSNLTSLPGNGGSGILIIREAK